MKKLYPTFCLLLFIGACTNTEKQIEVKDYSIDQFMNNKQIFGGNFSSDESKLLLTSDESGIYNIYTLPVSGGNISPLTNSDSTSLFAISYFPNDNRILFRSDKDGNEIFHIYLLNEDGTSIDLTPDSAARSIFYGWNFDKVSFLFGSNKRDSKFMDVYEMDLENFEAKMVYKNEKGFEFAGISRNEKYMTFIKSITTSIDEMYLYTVSNKSMKLISPQNANANFSPTGFSHENDALFYTTNNNSEFTYLVKYWIRSGRTEKILEADWDIWYSDLSYNGKYRVTGINNDARTELIIEDNDQEEKVIFPEDIVGNITGANISDSEKLMTFWVGSSKSPGELYIYNFETGEAISLLSSLNPEIDPTHLVEGEVIRYPSFDGLEIPAILYKPHQATIDNKVPALIWVHGGPGGQSRLNFFPLIQYITNKGYVILAVNNRGSSGYGKTFYNLDNQNHGENDLIDCVKAKDYLAKLDYIDTSNIGIIGGSYGGFMVMAALTSQPEAFKTGVNIFGVTNWLRTLKSIPPWWESFREALYNEMGNPESDSARLYQISPLFHADKITRPFMVLQGANDPRVLQVESDEIVAAARHNGVEVEYVLFEDEGHGFAKKENKIVAYEKIVQFLDKQLKGIEPKSKAPQD